MTAGQVAGSQGFESLGGGQLLTSKKRSAVNWSTIACLIPTYNRPDILPMTIKLLDENLGYPGRIVYFVGNDGDIDVAPVLVETLSEDIRERLQIICGPRRENGSGGLGDNLNKLLRVTANYHIDYLLQMDDDHWLIKPIDLVPHVIQLMDDGAGWIRLMGIGSHHYTATLEGNYWYVHWDSEGPYSLYIPSNRPHLKHRRFHDFYGYYPEGMKLGETEESFCHQCRRAWRTATENDNPPSVLVPLNNNSESAWMHVGVSWQSKGE